jgi:glycosyltransferase involved in cell wall biosynthesis
MFVLNKYSRDDTVVRHSPPTGLLGRTIRRVRREFIKRNFQQYRETRPSGLEPFSDDRTPHRLHDLHGLNVDVLNLHWVAGFVDYHHFFEECIGDTPVVWRLSDLNPFTGGCHYDRGCGKYKMRCGACPQLGSTQENDLSREIWERKQTAFDAIPTDQLHFVAQSEWIRDQVKAGSLTERFPATVIPNGLDETVFRPRSTKGLSSALDIPTDHRIVLFVAQSTKNHRKGFDLLQEALQELSVDAVTLVSIGSHEPELEAGLPHLHLGSIQSDLLLSVFYSLADVFVIPSRQDNLPNTVLESMACGTPVVSFDVGGIPDMVRPGETGWLAEPEDASALRQAIAGALSDKTERNRMADCCRQIVEEEYTLDVQARAYKSLYESLLNR